MGSISNADPFTTYLAGPAYIYVSVNEITSPRELPRKELTSFIQVPTFVSCSKATCSLTTRGPHLALWLNRDSYQPDNHITYFFQE